MCRPQQPLAWAACAKGDRAAAAGRHRPPWVHKFYQPWPRAGRLQPLTPAHLFATQTQWLGQRAGTRRS